MRGKRFAQYSSAKEVRITPADAGKTDRKAHGMFYTKDHPRGCGEND